MTVAVSHAAGAVYAMKATDYCRCDQYDNALPNWEKLKQDLGEPLFVLQDEIACDAIAYLVEKPPQVQKCINGQPEFTVVPLGGSFGAQALEAVKPVRNNLFHGGKNTPHSPPSHNEKLVHGALAVLSACLQLHGGLFIEFEHQLV